MTRSMTVALLLLAWSTPHGEVAAQRQTEQSAGVSTAPATVTPDPARWTVMTGINLSDDQKSAIVRVVAQYAEYEEWLSGKLKAKANYPDSVSKARGLVTKEQLSENRINQINAVRILLTEDQRVTFDNNLMEVLARYQKRQALEALSMAQGNGGGRI